MYDRQDVLKVEESIPQGFETIQDRMTSWCTREIDDRLQDMLRHSIESEFLAFVVDDRLQGCHQCGEVPMDELVVEHGHLTKVG